MTNILRYLIGLEYHCEEDLELAAEDWLEIWFSITFSQPEEIVVTIVAIARLDELVAVITTINVVAIVRTIVIAAKIAAVTTTTAIVMMIVIKSAVAFNAVVVTTIITVTTVTAAVEVTRARIMGVGRN